MSTASTRSGPTGTRSKRRKRPTRDCRLRHPLDDVPERLPALEKARVLQSKAAKLGLLDRAELAQANAQLVALVGDAPDERTIGELLWQLVALAKEHDVNAENALRAHSVRFRRAVGQQRLMAPGANCTRDWHPRPGHGCPARRASSAQIVPARFHLLRHWSPRLTHPSNFMLTQLSFLCRLADSWLCRLSTASKRLKFLHHGRRR